MRAYYCQIIVPNYEIIFVFSLEHFPLDNEGQ